MAAVVSSGDENVLGDNLRVKFHLGGYAVDTLRHECALVGIIGVGGMGKAHLEAYQALPNVDTVAVCDVDKEVAEKVVSENSLDSLATVVTVNFQH